MNDKFFDLKREKQDRIINAGLKIFSRYEYRHATTDDIVKEAHISKGLLFHYFTNKVGTYTFLMDYSVRYLILEISRNVKPEEEDFFEICRQIEAGRLKVLRIYPYMQAFLDRAFQEQSLEVLEACEEQKEAYRLKLEEYYMQCRQEYLQSGIPMEKMKQMVEYINKGILGENMYQDSMQPEMMFQQFCEYLDLLKGAFS